MARLSLTKASLQHEGRRLATFERFLPSLDLKRRQLIAERAKARAAIAETAAAHSALRARVADALPMAADPRIELDGLVRVAEVTLETETVVGARLPVLATLALARAPAAPLATPAWIDTLAELVAEALRLAVAAEIAAERLARLEVAVRKITQRVNLFDKVLIPETRRRIARIKIHLADAERAAVVRAKIAKRKRARLAAAESAAAGEAP